ncbi:MAG: mismatch repair endonuclease MutL [Bacteroidota bacterium]
MADIIRLLPDSVANQIAAGEVIQRPASVIKELVENSIDAGATEIHVVVKDAGKTLIQVTDNGSGMSATDARMAFERHATSKIKAADDLFHILTKGFRGEALASIAAIAHVELRSRQANAELGTLVQIEGSRFVKQEAIANPQGSTFSIRNLFYNTPARRKFLKPDSAELRLIVTEVQRIALSHTEVNIKLYHNDSEMLHLQSSNLRQRIVALFGKAINKELIGINTDTTLMKIHGFVGKPQDAKKRSGDQYFFVNNRYFKSSYFHKAVINAYEPIMAHGLFPSYFIYIEIDPDEIDVNIHPTKTEINFANKDTLFQIIETIVKEALGKFNITPSMDFGDHGYLELPNEHAPGEITIPSAGIDPNYNPFNQHSNSSYQPSSKWAKGQTDGWESFYKDFENQTYNEDQYEIPEPEPQQQRLPLESPVPKNHVHAQNFYQLKNKYILTTVKSGLMMIDQRRAHERILYEYYLNTIQSGATAMQANLYPSPISLAPDDAIILRELIPQLRSAGFDIAETALNLFIINASPANLPFSEADKFLLSLIERYKYYKTDLSLELKEKTAISLAQCSAISNGQSLSQAEMQTILDNLFACQNPNYTPDGKTVMVIIETDEIETKFQ